MQTTAIKVKGYSVSRQIVGGFWKGDIDLRDLLVDPEESQLLAGGASELSDDASAAEPAAASPAADAAPAKATAPLSMSAVEEDDPDEDAGAGSGQAAEVTSPSALPDPDADDAAADAGGDGMADVSLGTVEEKSTHANDLSAQLDSTFVVQGKGGEGEGDDAEEVPALLLPRLLLLLRREPAAHLPRSEYADVCSKQQRAAAEPAVNAASPACCRSCGGRCRCCNPLRCRAPRSSC